MKLTTLTFSALALAGVLGLSSMARLDGKKAEYAFRDAPVNALGIKSLAELRGKPVLIDFWGVH